MKKRKTNNKIKLIITVTIVLILLIILFANRNKLLKQNQIAESEYSITINQTIVYVSGLITNEPNVPVLGAGMIPIKWNEDIGVWQITTVDDNEWYNYASGKYANIMLSDGRYSSEIARDKELAVNGYQVSNTELGTVFTWVPRLMYKENNIEYLKDTNLVEYEWTTPSCFTYPKEGAKELDLAFTGMWVGKERATEKAIIKKNEQMNIEDNTYGLIKNEIVSTITEEERIVVEKLNQKCGNTQNEKTLINMQAEEYTQTIKILNTNMYSPITTQHDISADTVILKTIYKQNDIRCVLDENGKELSNNVWGNANQPVDEELEQYVFYVIDVKGNIKRHAIMYEPMGKPNLKGFNPNTTFYVVFDENGNEESIIPIGEPRPKNWYDYEKQMWANIVVRNNGTEAYYTWIPRYMYKLNTKTQRSEVKFVDKYNQYTDMETGKVVSLNNSEYILPEAFTWNGEQLKGFWMSKYELSGEEATLTLAVVGGANSIRVSDVVNKTAATPTKYEAYLIKDGVRVAGPVTVEGEYTFTNVEYGKYVVLLVGIDDTGNQVLGITKEIELYELEQPSIIGFVAETTYLVTCDEEGNEYTTITIKDVIDDESHINEAGTVTKEGKIDISKVNAKLEGTGQVWYEYTKQIWPNIVIRNNNKEAYYTWIPRYEYILDTTNKRSNVKLIPRTKKTADAGYTIPEAFTWNGTELAGYWMSKYELGT